MVRMILASMALAATGCASQPTPSATAATPAPAAAASAANTPASAPARTIDQILTDAKRQGYTVVNQNGEEQVCRTQLRTGSRLVKDTYCMTPAEFDDLRRRTQEGLANTMTAVPPKQFK